MKSKYSKYMIFLVSIYLYNCNQVVDSEKYIYVFDGNKVIKYEIVPEVHKQKSKERVWKERKFSLRFTSDAKSLSMPTTVRILNDSTFLVWDAGYTMLKKINDKGEVLQKIGGEIGQGPGEFNQINKFDVDAEGNYYFLDQGRRAILQFNADGVFQKNLIQFTKEVPWQFSVVGDKIILDLNKIDGRFQVFDLKGNKITKFFNFLKRLEGTNEKKGYLVSHALTASTVSTASEEFVVVHLFTDMVIHCKKEPRNCTIFRGIDEMPLLEVITNYADGVIYIGE